ncbi:hypothetical protein DMB92_01765 [Campylobacter sp. MIT 99-7217]|uniref:ankyrin repeat domain-containing protein n=1 Tax=Campylobacter sp. MIT 99-7217 TaxID=535091 RepID=UPI001158CF38|nr:ankyrin repeat domain-containing protein [Campylobacter sp. MIT 99-7217]TQR34711.1 hypothetical protein DMB92_01765 [Campylobacter sp. MIT 99-7217]
MKKIWLLCLFIFFCKADECEFLLQNKNTPVNKEILEAANKCQKSLANQKSTQALFKLANEIRGSNSACAGIHYLSNLQNFKLKLAKISIEKTNFEKRENLKALQDYFEYWAYQSVGNFKLYKDFYNEYEKAKAPLNAFFQKELKLSSKDAKTYTENALNEFFLWAVGETKIFKSLSEIQRVVTRNSLSALRNYIYANTPDSTELSLALRAGLLNNVNLSIIKELLNFGAKIDEGYESALFYALFSLENTKFLLEQGANVNYANSFGKTPLFYAVEFNLKQVSELLISKGANVNAFYINKNEKLALSANVGDSTPYYITLCALEHTSKNVLMHAASFSDTEILKLLVAKGADIKRVDDLGFNALDFALAAGKKENAQYLKSLGLKENENLFYEGSLE